MLLLYSKVRLTTFTFSNLRARISAVLLIDADKSDYFIKKTSIAQNALKILEKCKKKFFLIVALSKEPLLDSFLNASLLVLVLCTANIQALSTPNRLSL